MDRTRLVHTRPLYHTRIIRRVRIPCRCFSRAIRFIQIERAMCPPSPIHPGLINEPTYSRPFSYGV